MIAAGGGKSRKWRRERDSNPRGGISAYTISNRAPSTTRTSLREGVTHGGTAQIVDHLTGRPSLSTSLGPSLWKFPSVIDRARPVPLLCLTRGTASTSEL